MDFKNFNLDHFKIKYFNHVFIRNFINNFISFQIDFCFNSNWLDGSHSYCSLYPRFDYKFEISDIVLEDF